MKKKDNSKIIIFIIGLLFGHLVSSQIVKISNDQGILDLFDHTYILNSQNDSLDLNDLKSGEWTLSKKGGIFGIVNKKNFIRFKIDNTTTDTLDRFIYIPTHLIHEIDFLHSIGFDTISIENLGTRRPFSEKIKHCVGYPFRVSMPPGVSEIYVGLDNRYYTLKANAYLLTEAQLDAAILTNQRLISSWRGVFYFALLISFVLFIYTRQKLPLIFSLNHVGTGVFLMMEFGDYFLIENLDLYDHSNDIRSLAVALLMITFPLLLNELVQIKKNNVKTWKVMMTLIYVTVISMLILDFTPLQRSPIHYVTEQLINSINGLLLLFQIYFLVKSFKMKLRNSGILLLVYSIYLSMAVFFVILPDLGVLRSDFSVYRNAMMISMIDAILFLFLIARENFNVFNERKNLIEKQKYHQREMLIAVVEGQEKERNRVGRELHDMVGANMSVIKQKISKEEEGLRTVVSKTIESIRNLSHGLVTPRMSSDEFVDEITELCHVASTDAIRILPYFHAWQKIESTEVTTSIFRIIQELIQNAIKHSQGKAVHVQFMREEDNLLISYEDDGIGFDFGSSKKKGVGLKGIHNRLDIMHGQMSIQPGFQKGVNIDISIPIK